MRDIDPREKHPARIADEIVTQTDAPGERVSQNPTTSRPQRGDAGVDGEIGYANRGRDMARDTQPSTSDMADAEGEPDPSAEDGWEYDDLEKDEDLPDWAARDEQGRITPVYDEDSEFHGMERSGGLTDPGVVAGLEGGNWDDFEDVTEEQVSPSHPSELVGEDKRWETPEELAEDTSYPEEWAEQTSGADWNQREGDDGEAGRWQPDTPGDEDPHWSPGPAREAAQTDPPSPGRATAQTRRSSGRATAQSSLPSPGRAAAQPRPQGGGTDDTPNNLIQVIRKFVRDRLGVDLPG